jgi:hypothetical protein
VCALLSAITVVFPGAAETPLGSGFTYQGELKQAGQPMNSSTNLVFALHDAPSGGNLLGSQTLNGVAVTKGRFTVELNTAGQFGTNAFNGHERWLDITVNGTPLTPRQELTAAPYALFSAAPWATAGADISYTAGKVSIGTPSPSGPFYVQGAATASQGAIYGLQSSGSTSGAGVYGVSTSSFGVYGNTTSSTGVAGFSNNANGVEGQSGNASAYGAYAWGKLGASGTKSFRIDHPLDPENKYLMHYCTEGPEPTNAYRGRAQLDDSGEAWVELPAYFAEISKDPQVQLTPVGAAMPNLHVAADVQGNAFQIAGGEPQGQVFRRVEAVRNDLWVRAYGAPVEVDKAESERGTYQHPELYGQPAKKGVNYPQESPVAPTR